MLRYLSFLLLYTLCALAEPTRIVSTSPSATDILYAIGVGPRVVGVSLYCRNPKEALALPKVGTYRKPDVEKIARLRPDVVILHETSTDVRNRLQALGIKSVVMPYGSLEDTFQAIRVIGDAVSAKPQAEALVSKIRGAIARTHGAASGLRRSAIIIVGRDMESLTSLVAAGPGSYLGELLQAAGGVNALQGDHLPAYPRISLETVMRLDPDVIIDAADMGDRAEESDALRSRVVGVWRQRPTLKAVRNQAVYPVFADTFTLPGPHMLETLSLMGQALQGAPR